MTYLYNLPNATSGMDAILVDTVDSFPFMTPLLLLFVFFVVFLGGITRQRMKSGFADYAAWAVLGSISMMIVALAMSLIEGMIRLDWLVIVIVITIFSGVWFFLEKRSGEI